MFRYLCLMSLLSCGTLVSGCYVPPEPESKPTNNETVVNSSLAGTLQVGNFTASLSRAQNARALYQTLKSGGQISDPVPSEIVVKRQDSKIRPGELVFFFERGQWHDSSLERFLLNTIKRRHKAISVKVPHCSAGRFCLVH